MPEYAQETGDYEAIRLQQLNLKIMAGSVAVRLVRQSYRR